MSTFDKLFAKQQQALADGTAPMLQPIGSPSQKKPRKSVPKRSGKASPKKPAKSLKKKKKMSDEDKMKKAQRLAKKEIKKIDKSIDMLLEHRLKLSPKMRKIKCPPGCVRPNKSKGQDVEADLLQNVVDRAASLDDKTVAIYDPFTMTYDTTDAVTSEYDLMPSPTKPRKAPAGPSHQSMLKMLREQAEGRGAKKFEFDGATYVKYQTKSGKPSWKKERKSKPRSPCTQHSRDPTTCASTAGCKYVDGATRKYCTSR